MVGGMVWPVTELATATIGGSKSNAPGDRRLAARIEPLDQCAGTGGQNAGIARADHEISAGPSFPPQRIERNRAVDRQSVAVRYDPVSLPFITTKKTTKN